MEQYKSELSLPIGPRRYFPQRISGNVLLGIWPSGPSAGASVEILDVLKLLSRLS